MRFLRYLAIAMLLPVFLGAGIIAAISIGICMIIAMVLMMLWLKITPIDLWREHHPPKLKIAKPKIVDISRYRKRKCSQ
ncbi:MAG: hypothetical protein IM596_07860 [Pseudanabaena sp. M051S1SP2A07QC]|nr:hypothetical protein [Pseudanabaena sp. M051S1SP2A07QC]